jgi:hypothetical protein
MSLPAHLEALKAEALRTSCIAWAIRKRWVLAKTGTDRAGPCPVCGGKDRFSIHTVTDVFNCRRCGLAGHGVIDLVMQTEKVDFTKACEIITGRSASEPVDEARAEQVRRENEAEDQKREAIEAQRRKDAIERAGKILRRGFPVRWDDPADPVVNYLRGRGIVFGARQPKLGVVPSHPWVEKQGNLWVTLHEGPAMIAGIRRADGTIRAVHQTWLDPTTPSGKLSLPPAEDGRERAIKKVVGSKKGGSIGLYTPRDRRRIVMGEGIETTLTAMAHNFEEGTAYWAGVDLGNMAGRDARDADGGHLWDQPDLDDRDCFLPPDWCEELIYLCDGDDARNHTEEKCIRGLRRALMLRDRARHENADLPALTVSYVPPLGEGKDLNDLVRVSPP